MAAQTSSLCLELEAISLAMRGQAILDDITLRVGERQIVSIIGPNGAGKTTLFDVICGHRKPTSGAVRYRGQDVSGWPPHRICHAGVARTFQIARPFPDMTAVQNVMIGGWFGKSRPPEREEIEEEALELLETVGIGQRAFALAKTLTLSELRRLEVARALATRPHLLLLDEIAAGLSPQVIRQSVELIRNLRERGLTLIIIDHFLNLTARVSDVIVALDQGRKIAEGTPAEVLRSRKVVSAYLGEPQ